MKMSALSPLRDRAGFTLLEILLVVSLLAVVAGAVMASFVQGARLFERLNVSLADEENAFVLEKLSRDLKNGVRYSLVPWEVRDDSISFPSLPAAAGDPADAVPVRVEYRIDPARREIVRTETAYPYDRTAGRSEVVGRRMQSLSFAVIRESEESAPSDVTVSVEYGDPQRLKFLKKHLIIPCGYREAGS